jgi:hypothetical protein
MSLEETVSILAALSNAGIEGERAGTALRGAISRLAAPSNEAAEALANYGLSLEDVNPATHTFTQILDTLSAAGITSADVMQIFGQEAGPGVLALLGQGTGAIKEQTLALENSKDAAKEMAATMEGGVGGAWRQFTGSVETLAIVLGDLVAKGLTPVIEFLTRLFNVISGLPEPVMLVVVAVGALAAAIGPVLIVAGTLITSVGAITTALGAAGLGGALATVVGILTGPVAIAIAAFAAAAYIVYKNWDTIGPQVEAVFSRIQTALQPLIEQVQAFITTALERLGAWWATNGPAIQQAATTTFNAIGAIIGWLVDNVLPHMVALFQTHFDTITGVLMTFASIVGNVIATVANLINGDWSAAWDSFTNIFKTEINKLPQEADTTMSQFGPVVTGHIDAAAIQAAAHTGTLVAGVSSQTSQIVPQTTSAMAEFPGAVVSPINAAFAPARTAAASVGTGATTGLTTGMSGMPGVATSAMNGVESNIRNSGTGLASAANSAGQQALTALQTKFNQFYGVVSQFKSAAAEAASAAASVPTTMPSSGHGGSSSSTGSTGIKRQGKDGTGEENVKIREAHATGGVAGYTGWHWMEKDELAIPKQTNWDALLVQPIVKAMTGSSSGSVSAGNVIIQNMPVTLTSGYNFEQLMADIEKYNSQKRFQRGISL